MTNVLVVGAGASGLVAARALAQEGMSVVIFEARDRLGGRIHTVRNKNSNCIFELGAEFVHGKLPLTFQLLDEAKLKTLETAGIVWQSRNGELKKSSFEIQGWGEFEKQMRALRKDISIGEFLEKYFSGEKHAKLRESVRRFAEGYDLADPSRASAFALRDEWLAEEDLQYRIEGGYGKLIEFLAAECGEKNCAIHFSTEVKEIHWEKNSVTAITSEGKNFSAEKILVTVPLSLLQQEKIIFSPGIEAKTKAAKQMGYGTVIKILFLFDEIFWDEKYFKQHTGIRHLGFLFCDSEIPTWWTQAPDEIPLLTGWLGGPRALKFSNASDDFLLEAGIESLAKAFSLEKNFLKKKLSAYHVVNWLNDPFSLGAYAYETVQTKSARKILKLPVEQTLFFGGEALAEGNAGTVEAALASGLNAATKILES